MSAICKVRSVSPPTNNKLVKTNTIRILIDRGSPRLSNQDVRGNSNRDNTRADANKTNKSFSQIIPMIKALIEKSVAASLKMNGDLLVMLKKLSIS
jgi:hypothetical protein